MREVQKQIETLDMMKLKYCSTFSSNGDGNSNNSFIFNTKGKQPLQPKQQCMRTVKEAVRNSESVVTTKWETFD